MWPISPRSVSRCYWLLILLRSLYILSHGGSGASANPGSGDAPVLILCGTIAARNLKESGTTKFRIVEARDADELEGQSHSIAFGAPGN